MLDAGLILTYARGEPAPTPKVPVLLEAVFGAGGGLSTLPSQRVAVALRRSATAACWEKSYRSDSRRRRKEARSETLA